MMKRTRFFFSALAAVGLLTVLTTTGCGKKPDETTHTAHTAQTGQSADSAKSSSATVKDKYTCPMHPEVVSDKAGSCPKCKMDLVKAGEAFKLHEEKYAMTLTTAPATVTASKPVLLKFAPQLAETKTALALQLAHEQLMHLIIVSADLSTFEHLHPVQQPDGSLTITTAFPHAGYYRVFADVLPKDAGHNQVFDFDVMAEGGTAKPDAPLTLSMESVIDGGYKAALSTSPAALASNTSTALTVSLSKGGKPITDLGKYMGSLAHLVIISEDGKLYLHTHPEDGSEHNGQGGQDKHDGQGGHSARAGRGAVQTAGMLLMDDDKITGDKKAAGATASAVKFETNFPKAGKYKVFVQINHGGKIHTFNFGVEVN